VAAVVTVSSNIGGMISSPPSPGHLKFNDEMREQAQKSAWAELIETMTNNGGKLPRGAVVGMGRKYEKQGCTYVMEDHL
jgi:hypothetical protein